MDIRQMKLALTVDLMNLPVSQNPLSIAKKAMDQFRGEAGRFKGLFLNSKFPIAKGFERQNIALQFENCTLDLDIVSGPQESAKYIQGFNLKAI